MRAREGRAREGKVHSLASPIIEATQVGGALTAHCDALRLVDDLPSGTGRIRRGEVGEDCNGHPAALHHGPAAWRRPLPVLAVSRRRARSAATQPGGRPMPPRVADTRMYTAVQAASWL